jgi:antitoxin component YwqK of YwqJK toxin-antitoxin module
MRHGKAYIFLAMDKWQYEEENKVNRVWHECIYKNDDKYQDIYFHKGGGYQVEHLKNWEKHGIAESYFPNGNMRYKRKYVEGKLDGHEKYFYEDGSRYCDIFYIKGLKQGSYISYQKDGNFLERRNYEDGYISGLFIKNHRGSKEIECRGSYIPITNIVTQKTALAMENNYKIIVEYLKSKKINSKNTIGLYETLSSGKVSLKSGIWEYYDEQGKLQTRVLFKNGKKV